jgi:hypothetical protein
MKVKTFFVLVAAVLLMNGGLVPVDSPPWTQLGGTPAEAGVYRGDISLFHEGLASYGYWRRHEPNGWVWRHNMEDDWRPFTAGYGASNDSNGLPSGMIISQWPLPPIEVERPPPPPVVVPRRPPPPPVVVPRRPPPPPVVVPRRPPPPPVVVPRRPKPPPVIVPRRPRPPMQVEPPPVAAPRRPPPRAVMERPRQRYPQPVEQDYWRKKQGPPPRGLPR